MSAIRQITRHRLTSATAQAGGYFILSSQTKVSSTDWDSASLSVDYPGTETAARAVFQPGALHPSLSGMYLMEPTFSERIDGWCKVGLDYSGWIDFRSKPTEELTDHSFQEREIVATVTVPGYGSNFPRVLAMDQILSVSRNYFSTSPLQTSSLSTLQPGGTVPYPPTQQTYSWLSTRYAYCIPNGWVVTSGTVSRHLYATAYKINLNWRYTPAVKIA